jgi:5-hydroxyisourate hydrolase-like protein (transthyretin family)
MSKRIPSIALLASILVYLCLSVLGSVPAYAASTGHITGQLLDGSNSNAPLANQQVTLQIAEGNNTRDLATATTDAQGNFSFDNLAANKTVSYAVYIRYQGAQYVSGLITLDSNPSPQLNLTVYQATQRTDNIAIVSATVLLHEPNVQKGTITVSEVFDFMNLTNRTYVGSLDASQGRPNALSFSLPANTSTITLGKGFPGYQVIQVDHGMASDAAILPGQNEFSFSFEVPYNASTFELNYTTMYPTVSLAFLIPPDIHASSDKLLSQGVVPGKDQHLYNRFVANVLPANKNIQLHLDGLAVNAPLNMGIIWLIVAILLMGLLVFVTWFLLQAKHHQSIVQSQKERKQAAGKKSTKNKTIQVSSEEKGKSSLPADRKQELLEELFALDQAYETGKLDEAIYQERRSKAKAQLRLLMEV